MIDKGEGDRQQKQMQRENLRQVIQYCENHVDCRRSLILGYFDERFDRSQCHGTCDNCEQQREVISVDVTEDARKLCQLCKINQSFRLVRFCMLSEEHP